MIVSAAAVPSPLSSRIYANEASAKAILRAYAEAQENYRKKTIAWGDPRRGVGYCGKYRNLYYGADDAGQPLHLIDKHQADAYIDFSGGPPTAAAASDTSEGFNGYYYADDPYVDKNRLSDREFGLFAVPKHQGLTGFRIFWIGKAGEIFSVMAPRDAKKPVMTAEDSPLHPENRRGWEKE